MVDGVVVSGWFICSMRIWVRCAERNRRRVESTSGAVCGVPLVPLDSDFVKYRRFSVGSGCCMTSVEYRTRLFDEDITENLLGRDE